MYQWVEETRTKEYKEPDGSVRTETHYSYSKLVSVASPFYTHALMYTHTCIYVHTHTRAHTQLKPGERVPSVAQGLTMSDMRIHGSENK